MVVEFHPRKHIRSRNLPKNHQIVVRGFERSRTHEHRRTQNFQFDHSKCEFFEFADRDRSICTLSFFRQVIERKESNSFYSAIIFEAVLRRCGIRIECLYLSEKIHLLWRENWETDTDIYDINVFNGEIDPTTIYFMNRPNFSLYSPTEVLVRLSTCMNDLDGKLTE